MIGHLHPLLVHLPVGILSLALFFRYMAWRKGSFWAESLPAIVSIGLAGCLLSLGSGWFLYQEGGYEAELVESHKNWGIGLTLGTMLLLLLLKKSFASKLEYVAWPLLALALTVTGHKGGSLTHGAGYLNFFAQEYQAPVVVDVQAAVVFEEVIEPILAAKCWGCHSSKKQKGGLRLDSPEAMQRGGENGAILMAGHPEKSVFYERLLLPEENEEHMPPDGKPQLTPQELKVLEWWISAGLPYAQAVKELSPDAAVLKALKAVTTTEQVSSVTYLPAGEAGSVSEVMVDQIKDSGIYVSKVAAQSDFLLVTVLNPAVTDSALLQLGELKSAIVWLKISDRKLSEATLATIAGMNNLVKLELSDCHLVATDMAFLKGLTALKILNLKGSEHPALLAGDIAPLEKLESIYLFESNYDAEGIRQLQNQYPTINIDTGGYRLPTYKYDTTEFTREDLLLVE